MSFTGQSTVNFSNSRGVPGQLFRSTPEPRITPANIYTPDQDNVIGYACTWSDSPDDATPTNLVGQNANTAMVGGTGLFAGILLQPGVYASAGIIGSTLDATLILPNYTLGHLLTAGSPLVYLPAAAKIGALVTYSTTTGALSTVIATPSSSTYNQSTTVATITGFVSGGTPIRVGSVFTSSTGAYLGKVQSLGTGTGGDGTYNVETSATVSGATAVTQPVPITGRLFVPSIGNGGIARVTDFAVLGAETAVITL